MPPPSGRSKFAAQLTGVPPKAQPHGARAKFAAQLTPPRVPGGEQDATAPERVHGARAKHFANLRRADAQAAAALAVPAPVVVALPSGQLGVYAPRFAPLDPSGVFTKHVVWLPPTANRHHAVLRQGRPLRPHADIDWAGLWQRLLAALPQPKGGFIFYGDGHATGNVPTHARWGTVDGVYDITWLTRAMDVANAEWKRPDEYVAPLAEHIAWVMRLLNNTGTAQDIRGKVKLDALDEDLKGGADVAYDRLKEAGWVPAFFDSTAVRRLPVRAVLPKAVTYSGRKTSEDAINRAYARSGNPDIPAGGNYALNEEGDSVYVIRNHPTPTTTRIDTIGP